MNTVQSHPSVRRFAVAALVFATLALGLAAPAANAAPPAGTPIGNQATATYLDATSTLRSISSNLVTTYVQQVASFTLVSSQTLPASPGTQVVFPHVLTNTGNGADSLTLVLANLGGDDFDLSGLAIYLDADGNGVPDNATALTNTGMIPAGAAFRFVIVGNVPGTQVGGQFAQLRVTATSTFDGSQTAFNTDRVDVTGNAVIAMAKSINQSNGASPSGPWTYTLQYQNNGNSDATDLRLTDEVPVGMTFVAGSARWSVTGAAALTDADSTDWQISAGDSIRFIYDGPSRTLSTVIRRVRPGNSGSLTFGVMVDAGLAPQVLNNTARFDYNDGASPAGPFYTNPTPFTVNQTVSMTFTGQTVPTALQGSVVSFSNVLTNTGNGTDTFDITWAGSTFPAGSAITLLQSNGINPLTDSNLDGIPDTGPLAAGASYTVVLQVQLPANATGGPFQVVKTATSATNPAITGTATDILTAITANSVDVTNDAPLPGGLGVGAGPEVAYVVRNTTAPGTTSRFTLYVNNTSAQADLYNLSASTDPTFGVVSLPAGWTVTFLDAALNPIAGTLSVGANGSAVVYADVTVPAGAAAGNTDLYFRALSPNTGALDRIHDQLGVNAVRLLTLVPNGSAQVIPGGFWVYTHFLSNTGNVIEGDAVGSIVTLAAANSQAGWNSAIYWDRNGSGGFDAADTTLTDLSTIGGLNPGQTIRLFVRVSAPVGAPFGQVDVMTLSATGTNIAYTDPAPSASATDVTTIINGQLLLEKWQALDAGCDGTPDAAYVQADLTTGALPGACIRYEITITNTGTAPVTNVIVTDATPSNTTYSAATPAFTSQGTVTSEPAGGATGSIVVDVGTLAPGASATIRFGVRIDP